MPFPHEYLHAFPSYFGRFFSQYFARFLQDPAVSERQQAAYAQILEFLDNVTLPDFPKNVRECLESITPEEEQDCLNNSLANMRSLLKAPEAYIKAHRQTLEQYMDFRKSDEYRDSPAYQIQAQMKRMMDSSGYYETFIPAMKELSPSYAEYAQQLTAANQVFLSLYPSV